MLKKIFTIIFICLIASSAWAINMGAIDNGALKFGKGINIYQSTGIDLSLYNFYTLFQDDVSPIDQVADELWTITLDANRPGYGGGNFAINTTVIENNKALFYGAFDQFVPHSENTGNWTGSGPWTQSITLTSSAIPYTVSTDLNGATIDITAGTATIDGAAQATFGNDDQFVVSGTGTITITTDTADPKAQITLSPYKLPYAINTGAGTLSVPANNSAAGRDIKAEGIADNFPQLLDGLDGVASGVELVTDGSFLNGLTDWDTAFSLDSTITVESTGIRIYAPSGVFCELSQDSLGIGVYSQVEYEIISNPGGTDLATDMFGVSNQIISGTVGVHTIRGIPSVIKLEFERMDNTDLIINNISAKAISDAKGRMIIHWIPHFAAADVTGQISILTANNTAIGFLYYDADAQQLKSFDGTNTAVVACVPVNGQEYQIVLDWGDDSGQKMRISVDSTIGAQVTHAGSYPIVSDLEVARDADAPQEIGSIIIEKEPTWTFSGVATWQGDANSSWANDNNTSFEDH